MRPSSNKVDLQHFVFLSSAHRGYAVSSNPNSHSPAKNLSYLLNLYVIAKQRMFFPVEKMRITNLLDFSEFFSSPLPIDVYTFHLQVSWDCKRNRKILAFFVKGIRHFGNSSGKPFFLRKIFFFHLGNKIHTSTSITHVLLLFATFVYICLLLKPPFFG